MNSHDDAQRVRDWCERHFDEGASHTTLNDLMRLLGEVRADERSLKRNGTSQPCGGDTCQCCIDCGKVWGANEERERCAKICDDVARTIGALSGSSIHVALMNAKAAVLDASLFGVGCDDDESAAELRAEIDESTPSESPDRGDAP